MAAEGDKNAKEALKTEYFNIINTELKKLETRFFIKMTIYLCKLYSPFLLKMQRESPQISNLYEDCCSLVKKVMGLLLQEDKIPSEGPALAKVEVSRSRDHLDCPKMNEVTAEAFRLLPSRKQDKAKEEIQACLTTMISYLQANLMPLTSRFIQNLKAMEPKWWRTLTDKGTACIMQVAKEMSRFSEQELASLEFQWDLLVSEGSCLQEGGRLDVFYAQELGKLKKKLPEVDFSELTKFVELAFSLPVGNASVERGFSCSKQFLDSRESLSLESLKALKVGKEALNQYGSAADVPVGPTLIAKHLSSYAAYSKRLEEEKKESEKTKERIRQGREEARKMEEEEQEKLEFETKKRSLEEEEKSLMKQIKFKKKRLAEMQDRGMNAKTKEEIKSIMSSSKVLLEDLHKEEESVRSVKTKIQKLLEKKVK